MRDFTDLPLEVQKKIYIDPTNFCECWFWTGGQSASYGVVQTRDPIFRPNKSNGCAAHRYVYTTLVGEIPLGLEIDHVCKNRLCVNPAHLEAVTHAENQRRRKKTKINQSVNVFNVPRKQPKQK